MPSLPDFGGTYHVKGKLEKDRLGPDDRDLCTRTLRCLITFTGVISLPYAEIVEPFEGWFDLTSKSSRIDYYHGKKTTRPLVCGCSSDCVLKRTDGSKSDILSCQ